MTTSPTSSPVRSSPGVIGTLKNAILLTDREAVARGQSRTTFAELRALVRSADQRLAASRELVDVEHAGPRAALVADAIAFLVRARHVATGATTKPTAPELFDALRAELPSGLALDLARNVLAAEDPTERDALTTTRSQSPTVADDLEAVALAIRTLVEPRSLTHVIGLRRGRVAALALIAVVLVYKLVATLVAPRNIALNKPVTLSSQHPQSRGPETLVDGNMDSSFDVHTQVQVSPSATIDLGRTEKLQGVRVYNRGDGYFDECLPLVIELSDDGITYREVGRRTAHFDQRPPWTLSLGAEQARFVRVRADRMGALALSEVEVF